MRNVWVLALIVAGSALASSLAVEFGGETSQVGSYAESGKLWAQSEALALALGVRTDASPAGGKLTFRLGKNISYAAPITLRGKQAYVIALEVARNLGYTVTLSADGSRLTLKYEKRCAAKTSSSKNRRNASTAPPARKRSFRWIVTRTA